MNIDIRSKNIEMNATLREYIKRRLGFAFGARESQIQSVQIMLSDINGPKGGKDKRCRILVHAPSVKEVIVEDYQSELRVAVDRAAARASQTLTRRLMKWQQTRHFGVRPTEESA